MRRGDTYLSHISTYLPRLRQEFDSGHPLVETKACLARKVMEMRDQSLQNIFHARIFAQRVDQNHVLGDVVDGEVEQGGGRPLGG